jgi:hypothetical protein
MSGAGVALSASSLLLALFSARQWGVDSDGGSAHDHRKVYFGWSAVLEIRFLPEFGNVSERKWETDLEQNCKVDDLGSGLKVASEAVPYY